MKFLLIIWLITRGDGQYAEPLGGIESAEFKVKETCMAALEAIKAKAKYINGVCVEG